MRIAIAEFTTKRGVNYVILRDLHSKWYVYNGQNEESQTNLNASEIVRWLANALEGK